MAKKFNPNPKFLGTAEAYFVCHFGPIFQISLIYAFIGCPKSVSWLAGCVSLCSTSEVTLSSRVVGKKNDKTPGIPYMVRSTCLLCSLPQSAQFLVVCCKVVLLQAILKLVELLQIPINEYIKCNYQNIFSSLKQLKNSYTIFNQSS